MRGSGTIFRRGSKVATVEYSLKHVGRAHGAPYVGTITVTDGGDIQLQPGETVTLVLVDGSLLNITVQSRPGPTATVEILGGRLYGVMSTGPLSLPGDD
jgi:hypothetical protein